MSTKPTLRTVRLFLCVAISFHSLLLTPSCVEQTRRERGKKGTEQARRVRGQQSQNSVQPSPVEESAGRARSRRKPRVAPSRHMEGVSTTYSKKSLDGVQIFKLCNPAVFTIYGRGSQGSGFFVGAHGIAATNYHVIDGERVSDLRIRLADDRVRTVGQVLYAHEANDVAVLKVDYVNQIYIPLVQRTPQVGEKVFAIGSPKGLNNTFSSGEISRFMKEIEGGIQTSASIDHGSSGGVLLNTHGEAIGITSGAWNGTAESLNFVRSVDLIRNHLP